MTSVYDKRAETATLNPALTAARTQMHTYTHKQYIPTCKK